MLAYVPVKELVYNCQSLFGKSQSIVTEDLAWRLLILYET